MSHSQNTVGDSQQVQASSQISANIGIHWSGHDCRFSDWMFVPVIKLWRDSLPPGMQNRLIGTRRGDCPSVTFAPGELLAQHDKTRIQRLARSCFQPPASETRTSPRVGRFYPSDYFHGINGIYRGNSFPCRVIEQVDDEFTVDFNHPLAERGIGFELCIDSVKRASAERGGRCLDIGALCTDLGPGMQDRLAGHATEFWSDAPFSRIDEGDDSAAFEPRLTPFWDERALAVVSRFYRQHLHDGLDVLDLMAGVHSPLQESGVAVRSMTGVGLNRIELEHNPLFDRRLVHNVNNLQPLAFDDASFDCVLVHAAFEYATDPPRLIAEIRRILRPRGALIISFSDRYVADKAIRVWTEIQPFERTGLILSLLREDTGFADFVAMSQRGLPRPAHDELAASRPQSDPVFVVKALKTH